MHVQELCGAAGVVCAGTARHRSAADLDCCGLQHAVHHQLLHGQHHLVLPGSRLGQRKTEPDTRKRKC